MEPACLHNKPCVECGFFIKSECTYEKNQKRLYDVIDNEGNQDPGWLTLTESYIQEHSRALKALEKEITKYIDFRVYDYDLIKKNTSRLDMFASSHKTYTELIDKRLDELEKKVKFYYDKIELGKEARERISFKVESLEASDLEQEQHIQTLEGHVSDVQASIKEIKGYHDKIFKGFNERLNNNKSSIKSLENDYETIECPNTSRLDELDNLIRTIEEDWGMDNLNIKSVMKEYFKVIIDNYKDKVSNRKAVKGIKELLKQLDSDKKEPYDEKREKEIDSMDRMLIKDLGLKEQSEDWIDDEFLEEEFNKTKPDIITEYPDMNIRHTPAEAEVFVDVDEYYPPDPEPLTDKELALIKKFIKDLEILKKGFYLSSPNHPRIEMQIEKWQQKREAMSE